MCCKVRANLPEGGWHSQEKLAAAFILLVLASQIWGVPPEGMMIDRDVSVAHLLYFMKTLLSEVFRREVTVRLRPGFFPFVEPGFELDIQCLICGGTGCPVCKQSGWVELLPCGLVNPNVLRISGIDPEKWNGFAFGLGLTRLVMMRYGIDDIRLLQSGDLRFLEQF